MMMRMMKRVHVRHAIDTPLQGFEIVADIHLTTEAFTVENDLLTPTFKLKRPQARVRRRAAVLALFACSRQRSQNYFKAHIAAMYERMPKSASA
jgi:long-subunit acyl-CoA synthetase (AMP-forming)